MNRALLLLPDTPSHMEAIAQRRPLALSSFLGAAVLDHAIQALAERGVTHLRLVGHDPDDAVRDHVNQSHDWGLQIEVTAEPAALSVEAVLAKYDDCHKDQVHSLETLPQAPHIPLFADAATWHRAHHELAPQLLQGALGTREVSPGVWIGWKASVDPSAKLQAPCWIGPNSRVGARAVVGPHGHVESGCILGEDSQVVESTIAENTYLGPLTHVQDSIAAGSSLLNWRTASCLTVTDRFLLSPVAGRSSTRPRPRFQTVLMRTRSLLRKMSQRITFPKRNFLPHRSKA